VSTNAEVSAGLTDDDLPGLYRDADTSSLDGQGKYLFWTRSRLLLVVAASIAGLVDLTIKIRGNEYEAFAFVSAVCFLLAPVSEFYLLISTPDKIWYHGRAVAESVKTLAWRYIMRSDPFHEVPDNAGADALLLKKLRALIRDSPIAADFEIRSDDYITPGMRELRDANFGARKRAYLADRVDDQVKWYRKKAAYDRGRANIWRVIMLGLEVAGFSAALLLLTKVITTSIDGVVASMVAAAGAWLEVKQFESLANAYNLTATELSLAKADGESIASEEDWPQYVATTEDAISREHTMWRVRRIGLTLDA